MRQPDTATILRMPSAAEPDAAASTPAAVDVLLAMMGACAPHACGHARRVARSATAVARMMSLPLPLVDQIAQAALLHEIGKLAVPGPGPGAAAVDAELHAVVERQHVRIGFDVLSVAPHLRPAASIVIAVHERWDGFGYPAGLRGTEIPLGARIIAVADAYDVLTSAHRHRAGLSREEANAELVRGAGTFFDPDIVRAWLRTSDRIECS